MATLPMAGMILSTYLCASFPPLRSITVGLVVCLSLGSGLNSLFYQDPCPSATKSQCHSKLDRSLCGHCSSSLDLSSCRNQRDCLSRFSDWFWFDLSSLSPYLSWFEEVPLPSHLLGQEGIYCAPFSLLLAALVRCGWSEPSCLVLTDHGSCLTRFLFLCFDASTENNQRRFSTCFFSPDLSNSHHSDLFENGPRLVATAFLDSSRMAGNSSLSLDFSRCPRWLW